MRHGAAGVTASSAAGGRRAPGAGSAHARAGVLQRCPAGACTCGRCATAPAERDDPLAAMLQRAVAMRGHERRHRALRSPTQLQRARRLCEACDEERERGVEHPVATVAFLARWPGDGMGPPGDCPWSTYLALRLSVESAKAVVSMMGACAQGDSCTFLATKIAAISAEIAARVAVAATCFKGGDTDHRGQIQEKINMLNRCYRFFKRSNCSQALLTAMAAVVAAARTAIEAAAVAAAAVVVVAAVAALVAAIIALIEVIAAAAAAAAAAVAAAAEAALIASALAALGALLITIKGSLAPEPGDAEGA